jgi:hypothetical protein
LGGKGYWVYSPFDGACKFNISFEKEKKVTIENFKYYVPPLKKGYNLFGAPNDTVLVNEITDDCSFVEGPLYWDGENQKWVEANFITPGRGYWGYVLDETCTLDVTS